MRSVSAARLRSTNAVASKRHGVTTRGGCRAPLRRIDHGAATTAAKRGTRDAFRRSGGDAGRRRSRAVDRADQVVARRRARSPPRGGAFELAYADFEGIIPVGNYGAGTVLVWDTGAWTPLDDPETGLARGHLRFTLHGQRLQGHWSLVPHGAGAGEGSLAAREGRRCRGGCDARCSASGHQCRERSHVARHRRRRAAAAASSSITCAMSAARPPSRRIRPAPAPVRRSPDR
ncbi:MAG: hypothetical protein IT493_06150 [Gammaproteobacteria bacterium]|nr:hypothetical protein [Gammaproteobacteria bacterium]